ncbi:MAG: 2-amino-4-hydroxy-6-hydroxymethyldihydropteridine diphosphokinase [Burkholderiales bacterium]|nr:2-amino-4-hydroxy-6-hydroxymethyldihydropteridine diphosphokinase [Burkholderiales bacterium]
MTRAYVGLGSNLEDPRAQIERAFEALARLPRTRLAARSSVYRSAPLGDVEQPEFLNAVAALDTGLDAHALFAALRAIEERHGRTRPFPGAPRTLDLDLLLYGEEAFASAELAVPHPRMHERAFVLAPLAEIAREARVPGRGPVLALLAACAGQRIERLP